MRDDMNRIRRYFISDNEYNVNDVAGGEPIGGRFVFLYNVETRRIVPYALAEQSGPEYRKDKKAHYLEKRDGYEPGKRHSYGDL